jgi:hypothetical protein
MEEGNVRFARASEPCTNCGEHVLPQHLVVEMIDRKRVVHANGWQCSRGEGR